MRTNTPVQTYVKEERVVDQSNAVSSQATPLFTLARLVWFIASIVVILLALRFVLILLGANIANAFVNFIYSVSYPLARPFFGVFSYHLHYGVSRVELASLVAIVIYLLAAYLIVRLLSLNRSRV